MVYLCRESSKRARENYISRFINPIQEDRKPKLSVGLPVNQILETRAE